MAETQRNLFNKRVSGLWIAGAFVLLVTLFFAFRTPTPETMTETSETQPPQQRRVDRPRKASLIPTPSTARLLTTIYFVR